MLPLQNQNNCAVSTTFFFYVYLERKMVSLIPAEANFILSNNQSLVIIEITTCQAKLYGT